MRRCFQLGEIVELSRSKAKAESEARSMASFSCHLELLFLGGTFDAKL